MERGKVRSKKAIVLCLIAGISLLSGCAPSTTSIQNVPQTETEVEFEQQFNWNTWSNDYVQFDYPDTWELSDDEDLPDPIVKVIISDPQSDETSINLIEKALPLGLSPTVEEVAKFSLKEYQSIPGIKNARQLNFQPYDLQGQESGIMTIELTLSTNGSEYQIKQLIVPVENGIYCLVLGTSPDKAQYYDQTFSDIIQSFQLK